MTNREFDKLIARMMREYHAEYDPGSWEELADRLDVEDRDSAFDDAVKAAMTGYTAAGTGDWSRMEKDLVVEEGIFDDAVKDKVETYEAPYDAKSWPVLHQKVTESEILRRRLITAKVFEIAAILIAFVTLYNFFPEIHSVLIQPDRAGEQELQAQQDLSAAAMPDLEAASLQAVPLYEARNNAPASSEKIPVATIGSDGIAQDRAVESRSEEQANVTSREISVPSRSADQDVAHLENLSTTHGVKDHSIADAIHEALDEQRPVAGQEGSTSDNAPTMMLAPDVLASLNPTISGFDRDLGLSLASITPRNQNGLRVSMGASADLNILDIPDDIFYSQGRQIKFSAKELSAIGYSTGASVLFDRGKFSFETGLYYSLKQYEPNRVLHIGETFDVRTLDFQQINLNVVSVPMLVHWNFDQKGKVRLYATGGMNMNVIAVAHYDLIVKNRFSSSAAPSDPQAQRNSQEVARVREHILDGAEFSTKSYMALTAGFGVERRINHRFSIFGQPMFSYQIPFFGISDQNGKDLQFGSLLLGTRIKLK